APERCPFFVRSIVQWTLAVPVLTSTCCCGREYEIWVPSAWLTLTEPCTKFWVLRSVANVVEIEVVGVLLQRQALAEYDSVLVDPKEENDPDEILKVDPGKVSRSTATVTCPRSVAVWQKSTVGGGSV